MGKHGQGRIRGEKTIPVMSLFSNKMRNGTSPSYTDSPSEQAILKLLPIHASQSDATCWADKAKYDVKAAGRSTEPPLNSGTAR